MINGVHHVSFSTADMDRFLHFYCDVIGLPKASDAWVEPGFTPFETIIGMNNVRVRIAVIKLGNLHMEIFQYETPTPQPGETKRPCDVGIRHIAFDVTDIEIEYERLKVAGVNSFFSPPQYLGDDIKMRSIYLRDPDGNIVELQEILPGSIFDNSHVVGTA